MPLILRVDIDKPYGRNNIFEKIASKLKENFWYPKINVPTYLSATLKFIEYCNKNNIKAIFYFRNCTSPNKKVLKLLNEGYHKIGFHTEDTRSFDTFKNEIIIFKKNNPQINISSFTKHGSGDFKLGKNHYAPYEPDKYKVWAEKIKINYLFGNGICKSKDDCLSQDNFFKYAFWINKEYRNKNLNKLNDLLKIAKEEEVVIIIHPSNFIADKSVNNEFTTLVKLAKNNSINWIQK